jgi:hypothetical protein
VWQLEAALQLCQQLSSTIRMTLPADATSAGSTCTCPHVTPLLSQGSRFELDVISVWLMVCIPCIPMLHAPPNSSSYD